MKAIILLHIIILFCVCLYAEPKSAGEQGYEIMRQVIESYDGFLHVTGDLEMILINKSGKKKKRTMKIFAHEQDNDGDHFILLFKRPRDVQGTALLTYTHYNGINDQWIYLPAFKRTKRIADKSKTSPFMGSEFSYEDLNNMELPMYEYRFIKDDSLGDIPCHVVEIIPTYPNSAYSFAEVWVNQHEMRMEKIEFHDKDGVHFKTLTPTDYFKYEEKFWHPDKLTMVNHKNGKMTEFIIHTLDYMMPLRKNMFTTGALRTLDR